MFLTPRYSTKQTQLQLTNAAISCHDLACSCNNPGFHTLLTLAKQIGPELNKQERNQILQCLGDTTTATEPTAEEDHGLEDLEELFAEGATDDNG